MSGRCLEARKPLLRVSDRGSLVVEAGGQITDCARGCVTMPSGCTTSAAEPAALSAIPAARFGTRPRRSLRAGVHLRVVQERLGHPNVSITLDTYSHVDLNMQAIAARNGGALVVGGAKP